MAWETRGNGRYYYLKRRMGKQVVSEYVGKGEVAQVIAVLDQLEREQRELAREHFAREQEQELAIDHQLDEVGSMIRSLTTAVLLVTGYYAHRRQWRKRHE